MDGDWPRALALCSLLPLAGAGRRQELLFLIARHKYLELLEGRRHRAALACLQDEIRPHAPADALPALSRLLVCEDAAALKDVERDYVGKKGAISAMLAEIPKLDPADRKAHGQKANALKQSIQALADDRQAALDGRELDAARRADDCDPTLPPRVAERGSIHPITQVPRELEVLYISMGHEVLDGP